MDVATIWMIVWFTFLVTITALLLAPPTFISDLIDGDHKRKKKTDWTDEDD